MNSPYFDSSDTENVKMIAVETSENFINAWNAMVLSTFMRKKDCRQLKKELLCKGGIAESGLQVLHVHVLLVTPLGAGYMAQSGTD